MAPPNNYLESALSGVGKVAGQYFKYNFGTSYAGIPIANTAVKAGLNPAAGFATSLVGSSLLMRAANDSLPRVDEDKVMFGDEPNWFDSTFKNTLGQLIRGQGKLPRTYDEYLEVARSKGLQPLDESAFDAAKQREFSAGWGFRINREGEGSELVGRDTATLFGATIANPLWRLDSQLGKENVDRISTAGGLTALGVSANTLAPYIASKGAGDASYKAALEVWEKAGDLGITKPIRADYGSLGGLGTAKVIGGSLLKGVGAAAGVYGAVNDFMESKNAGDSDLRAVTNAAASTAGGYGGFLGGSAAAASLASPLLVTPLAPAVPVISLAGGVAGSLAGSGLGGWLSDRALDLFGEGKDRSSTVSSEPSADDLYRAADARLQRSLQDKQLRETGAVDMSQPNSSRAPESKNSGFVNYGANPYAYNVKDPRDLQRNPKYLSDIDANVRKQQSDSRKQDLDFQGNLLKYQLENQRGYYGIDQGEATKRSLGDQRNRNDFQVGMAGVGVDSQVRNRKIEYDSADNRFRTLADYLAAIDRNRVTGEVGFDANKRQLEGSKFKTTTEAATERFKWTTVNETDKYKRNTLDRTEIAKEQIKAGTYGRSQSDINSMAIESNARKVNQDFNDRMMQYGRYQMEINKFTNDVGNAQRSYMDQRSDLENERRAATARYNQEQAQKRADLEYDRQQRKLDRDRSYYEFDIRRNDTNATLAQQNAFRQQELAFRQQEINNSSALDQARIAQIYADTKLKNDQFGAGRADISYNRNQQRSRSIAF